MTGNQIEDVTTLTSRTICPESGFLAGQHDLQNVAHQELATLGFAAFESMR